MGGDDVPVRAHVGNGLMVETLKSFEEVAGRFDPMILIVPGLVMVALGLFVWLGGLGLRRALFAVIGAVVGGITALVILDQNVVIAGASAAVAACMAAVFQRFFTALLLGVLSLAITFVIVARPSLLEYRGALIAGQKDLGRGDQRLTVQDSLGVIRSYSLDVVDGVRYAAGRLLPIHWAVVAAVAAGLLTLGVLFRLLAGAMSCAILGTALTFAGLILLLIFKGSSPIRRMETVPLFYGAVFAGMAAFGTVEQFLLYRGTGEKPKAKAGKSRPGDGELRHSWRNR
jgi:hypothetical protein